MDMRRWTAEEDRLLRAIYPDHDSEYVAGYLHRSRYSVKARAGKLGVKKRPEAYEALHRKGQFRKGQAPKNKGRKIETWMSAESIERSKEGRFKKGECRADNPSRRPIGWEFQEKDGYVYVKCPDRKRRAKHRWVWEQAHGPIPKGMVIRFKDGDRTNCQLENLFMVSQAENLRLLREAMSPEAWAAMERKRVETRNERIRRSRLRMRWGLEPIYEFLKKI
jgi:hypothetical protein